MMRFSVRGRGEGVQQVKSLKNSKSPGTDGFPGEFYKTFMEDLAPKLCHVFNYALNENDPELV